MAWKDISASTFKKTYKGSGEQSGYIHVRLQYDDASISPTSVKLRFVLVGDYPDYWDMYYILLYPTDSSKRTLITLKDVYTYYDPDPDAWPYYAKSSFTITKSATADNFTIPAFWIICDGWDNTEDTATAFYNKYKEGGGRHSWSTAYGTTSIAIASSSTVAKNVTVKNPVIKDNGNNTFTITFYPGTAGTNNRVKSNKYIWKLAGDDKASTTTSTSLTKSITCKASAASQIVYARTEVDGTYNDVKTDTISKAIKNYQAPTSPGKPTISWTKSRMTLRENYWTLKWGESSATNSSSPVVSYRIRLYKKNSEGKFVSIPIINDDGENVSTKLSATDHPYDRDVSKGTSMKLYGAKCGLKAGDTIQVGIYAKALNGAGSNLWSGGGTTESRSASYTVQNAGIVHVNVDGTNWKEGQVWVNVDGTNWKEAETVSINVDGTNWKEST